MFSFLNPLLLILSAAALIPLAIHFLSREKYKRVDFPSLRFLLSSYNKTIGQIRLKQILLLLLRMLLILFLVLAIAGPLLNSSSGVFLGRRDVIIVLDNSVSMGYEDAGRTVLETAKIEAEKLVKSLSRSDNVMLISLSDLDKARSLETVKLSPRTVKLVDVMGRINKLFKENSLRKPRQSRGKEVYFISDRQKSFWREWEKNIIKADINYYLIDVGQDLSSNRYIEEVKVPAFIKKGETVEIKVKIKNDVLERKKSLPVTSWIEGEKIEEKVIDLAAQGSGTVVFKYEAKDYGSLGAEIRLAEDSLAADDRYYFVLKVANPLEIIVLNKDTAALPFERDTFYLEKAFAQESFNTKVVSQATTHDLADADMVFAVNPDPAFMPQTKTLLRYVKDGGGLVVFGEGKLDSGIEFMGVSGDSTRRSYQTMGEVEAKHPILAGISSRDLDALKFYSWFKAKVNNHEDTKTQRHQEGIKSIARLENGDPLIIESIYGEGKIIYFLTSADAALSNLCLSPAFVPIMHQTVYYLVGGEDRPPNLFGGLNNPGIFKFEKDGKTYLKAVNLDPAESQLEKIDTAFLEKQGIEVGESYEDLQTAAGRQDARADLSVLFLLGALIALMVERFICSL